LQRTIVVYATQIQSQLKGKASKTLTLGLQVGMSKWVGRDGPTRQPDQKSMDRAKKFNPPTRDNPPRQARGLALFG